eukprot:353377-Prorocentrum_minimum.AAC.4
MVLEGQTSFALRLNPTPNHAHANERYGESQHRTMYLRGFEPPRTETSTTRSWHSRSESIVIACALCDPDPNAQSPRGRCSNYQTLRLTAFALVSVKQTWKIKTLEVVILAKVLVSMYRHAHSTYFIPFPRTVDTVYVDVNRAEQAGLFIGEIHSRQYASGSTG